MFSTAAKISIAGISGLSMIEVDRHLIVHSAVIDADVEAAVLNLLADYENLPADQGVEIFPNEANFGARVRNSYTLAEERIKNTLIGLLNLPRPGSSITYLERG